MKYAIVIALLATGLAAAQDQPPLDPLRERITQLAVRIGPVRTSLQNLRQQMERSGLNLRTDIAETEQRLVMEMDAAEAAIDHGNAAEAKTKLDGAEHDLAILEKFLNR
jgi:predicted outer membrane protein